MPITRFQSAVLQALAAQRSPDSYVAGGIAINREGPRYSGDIDLFPDSEQLLEHAILSDEKAILAAGYTLAWDRPHAGRREASITLGDDTMRLEWATDSAYRFFPTQPDPLFGYVLHTADLATNKAAAAADRRVLRDIVDLLTIHDTILPLGAVIGAAVGKFPGTTPEQMLGEIVRHSRFTVDEFRALATDRPLDIPSLHRRIRAMIDDAEAFIVTLPSEAVGCIFMDGNTPVQPNVTTLDRYTRNPGGPCGLWPGSADIARAMLNRHTEID